MAAWQSIYCSLVLILVAFFVLLCTFAIADRGKVTNFMRGFGLSPDEGVSISGKDDDPYAAFTGGQAAGAGVEVRLPSRDIVEGEEYPTLRAMKILEEQLKALGGSQGVRIEEQSEGFKVTFGSKVLFPSAMAAVSPSAFGYLDAMIDVARSMEFNVRIEGHTDNVVIRSERFASNWELSTSRAVSVLRHFIDRGISPKRLTAVGYSQYRPIASNDSEEGRADNRRVELYFTGSRMSGKAKSDAGA